MVKAYFFDGSALVKRYGAENGSTWIESLIAPQRGNRLIITRITWVEVLSALARLQREEKLSGTDVAEAIRVFRHDLAVEYQIVEIDRTLTFSAGQLVQRYPLRAYDSIQLAAVLKLQPTFAQLPLASLTFIFADKRLLSVAQAEGLATDDPNLHS